MDRRTFIQHTSLAGTALWLSDISILPGEKQKSHVLQTVNGQIETKKIGFTLTHEHLLVDFTGADQYDPARWDDDEVIEKVTPYLMEIKSLGCRTFIDCTPEYIGRDPVLLMKLSGLTGINIVTNTGLYGAAGNKYMPAYAYRESSASLAERWIDEFGEGIGNTGIRPGFIKIGVAPEKLSELHKKLVVASAKAHLKTGLTIASHTGPALPAFEELDIIREEGVDPAAFVWVHAQNETSEEKRIQAAEMGAWVSLDGLNVENVTQYIEWLETFRKSNLLGKVLVSHDAGWYAPGEPDGGEFRAFTPVFKHLIPGLKKEKFTDDDIDLIFSRNPGKAFGLMVRKI